MRGNHIAGLLLSAAALSACTGNAKTPPVSDHWTKTDKTSKLDDTPGVEFSTDAKEGNEFGLPATLMIGCEGGKSYIYVDPHVLDGVIRYDTISADGRIGFKNITWRLDKQPAAPVEVQLGSEMKTFGWWGNREASATARKLAPVKSLVLHYDVISTGMAISTFEYSFDISGLDSKMAELSRTCKWPAA